MTTFYDRATTYNPDQDHARRWPEWRISPCDDLPAGAEVVVPDYRLFGFASETWAADPEWCRSHAVAHLDLADDPADVDCAIADTLAAIRLDREGSRQQLAD